MPLSPTTRPVASSLGATMSGPRIAFSKPKLTLNNKKEEEDILSNDIELDNEENQMIAKLSIASGRPSITSTNSISPSLSATTNNSALTPPPPSQAFFGRFKKFFLSKLILPELGCYFVEEKNM